MQMESSKIYQIHMPDLCTEEFEDVMHAVVWHVGRHFGFQAFNMNPHTKDQVCVEQAMSRASTSSPNLT